MNRLFYELKVSGKLPSPTGVGMRILQLTQEAETGLEAITEVIRSDPALTGRILKVANASPRTVQASITPLEEAVLRLGFARLRELALGFSLVSSNPKEICQGFDYSLFWHLSLGRAVAAQHLCELASQGSGPECYVCGLLCGVGRLGLASAHPREYSDVLGMPGADDPETLAELESRAFGINHRELTEALLGDWGFPADLSRVAAGYRFPEGASAENRRSLRWVRQTLRVAEWLAEALDEGDPRLENICEGVQDALNELEIEGYQIACTVTAVQASWAEWGALLKVRPPSRREARVPAAATPDTPGEAAEPGAARDLRPEPSVPSNALVLDSDEGAGMGFERWLTRAGFVAWRAGCIRQAVEIMVTQNPVVVIAHAASSDVTALGLCRALRGFEVGRRAYFLLATSSLDPTRLTGAFDAGVDDYLALPCSDEMASLRLRAAKRVLELRSRLSAQEKALQQNVGELAVANRMLHRAAMTDAVTQLPNRRFAEETLREEWATATARDLDFALIFGDIDHFKRINDTHGHLVGDMVLASVARVFRETLRSADVACRFGGEEFLVICPDTNLEGAREAANRLRERVAGMGFEISGARHHVTISFGVSSRCASEVPATTPESVLRAADAAVYASKSAGRNRVSVAVSE